MPTYENSDADWNFPSRTPRPSHGSKFPPKPHPQFGHASTPKPHVAEDTLKSSHVDIERKRFVFHLKENDRGRLLRITEETGSKRASIIIPSTGLKEFADLLQTMLDASPPEAAK
jgi:hypothetical protein